MNRIITQLLLLLLLSVDSSVMADNVVTVNGIKFDAKTAEVVGAEPIKDGVLTIPELVTIGGKKYAVTCIDSMAFRERKDIKQISLPKTLRKIRKEAFAYCENLESATLPENVDSLGDDAFSGCRKLKSFVFNDKIKVIPFDFFSYDISLVSIKFPENLEAIESNVFFHCESLTELIFPSKLKSLSHMACHGCTRLTKVVFPASLELLGCGVFGGCTKLTSITCLAPTPPSFDFFGEIRDGIYLFEPLFEYDFTYDQMREMEDNCTLYVPEGSIENYQQTFSWSHLGNISTGIKHITSSASNNGGKIVYDLSGRQISDLKKGIVVVKYNNGLIKKVRK